MKYWISKGAQPTDSIRNLLINKGVIQGKKVNVLPKKTPQNPTSPEATKGTEGVVPATPMEIPTEAEVVAEAEPAPEVTPAI